MTGQQRLQPSAARVIVATPASRPGSILSASFPSNCFRRFSANSTGAGARDGLPVFVITNDPPRVCSGAGFRARHEQINPQRSGQSC